MNRSLCWIRTCSILGAVLVPGAGRAVAQHQAGHVEIGAYAQLSVFDESLELDNVTGPGVRLGFFLSRMIALELDVAYGNTGDSTGLNVSYFPVALLAVFNIPLRDNIAVLLGPGFVHTTYGEDRPGAETGLAALVGLRFDITRRWSLRFDGRGDYFASPQNGAGNNINYNLSGGISYFVGGTAPQDTDRDGITDDLDQCPGTSRGLAVDATGCAYPIDSDGDGVLDTVDQCESTPAGARVDSSGCPFPSGGDGSGGRRGRW
jgi:OOP family OmpA-OmpF porin